MNVGSPSSYASGAGGGGLSTTLHAQFVDWAEQRKPQEQNMLEDYEHKMRIVREGSDQEGTGLARSQKSRVFIGSTRSKIRSARAKIKDILFGSQRMPFDTEPTQESLADLSNSIEDILTYQLNEMGWTAAIGLGIDDLATYGTGFIGGPFARMETYDVFQDGSNAPPVSIEYRAPYFERISPMDVYPDPEAETIQEGIGVYWGSRKPPHFIRALLGKPGYNQEAIRHALTQRITSRTDEGTDRLVDSRQNLYRYAKDGRIWFTRYFGLVSVRQLFEWKSAENFGEIDSEETVEAIVQMAGGIVIKADPNPYHMMRRPIYRCAYEDEPGEIWGTGIARNNRDAQKVINGSFQLYLEGKAFALLKMFNIDRSKFLSSEDFKLYPGKKFDSKLNLTPEERKSAIIEINFEDVTAGWENAIAMSERFSDDDTGITKYTQGDDSRHLNDTATGISMIMSASSLPLKEVIANIDRDWVGKMVNDLLQWNMEFLDASVVAAQLGEKEAAAWERIKGYGRTSFVKLKPTGSGTFMMREVLTQKLIGFMTAVLGNPLTAQLIDVRELLQQVWEAGEIGKESPVLSEQDLMERGAAGPINPGIGAPPVQAGTPELQPEIGGPPEAVIGQEGLEGLEGLAPASPPPPSPEEERQSMMMSLIAGLLQETRRSNEIAQADKVPVRDPNTGLIERMVVVQ